MGGGAGAAGAGANVNVGVLGHVDSGKTALARALSARGRVGTAALDKSPQSAARGITLDLGFSSFAAPLAGGPGGEGGGAGGGEVQFTLVDCPGHASLIRTVMGGAQIIDAALLVVDATKGIQTQTAECLVVGEILTEQLVVVLNKTDLLEPAGRDAALRKLRERLARTFERTRFRGCPMVEVAARPGGPDSDAPPEGLAALVGALVAGVPRALARRAAAAAADGGPAAPTLFMVDHCFSVKGQGTVATGTVLAGEVRVNAALEVPSLKLERKVKSIQMFRQPVNRAARGDRVGVCLAGFDAGSMERGFLAAPGAVPTFQVAVARVRRIRFFRGAVASKAKLHVTLGHATVMAELLLFAEAPGAAEGGARGGGGGTLTGTDWDLKAPFDSAGEYAYLPELADPSASAGAETGAGEGEAPVVTECWALLRFEQPVTCPADSMLIGSRLDFDAHAKACRLAVSGRLRRVLSPAEARPEQLGGVLRVYKSKAKHGTLERVEKDGQTAICKGLFKKETDLSPFVGMEVMGAGGSKRGRIQGTFGKSGKFKVLFPEGAPDPAADGPRIELHFKRFLFDADRRAMRQ